MELAQDAERLRLRRERDRLRQQIALLVATTLVVQDSGDPIAQARHQADLEQHSREFRSFRQDLERFRRLYGPLGE